LSYQPYSEQCGVAALFEAVELATLFRYCVISAMMKIRTYPHFDPALSVSEANALVSDPLLVRKHAFFPFISYPDAWTKYAAKGVNGKRKSRPIMYASRRDSCVYSHYGSLLSQAYERELASRSIGHAVLAYRRIPKRGSKGNKSNINFADDAFSEILRIGDCLVYTLDISKFFETLSHVRLKRIWMQILGLKTMPPDHYRVFRNVTRYATVNREDLYQSLGFIGKKSKGTRQATGYLVKRVPLQICSGKDFRQKVVPLITTNTANCGIPQGCPISDVLANLYLLEFDTQMVDQIAKVGGSYRRYSDDILMIVPGHADDSDSRLAQIRALLNAHGDNLAIQQAKTTVHRFSRSAGADSAKCQHLSGSAGKNGLEYLGFRFDGRKVFIRDSTRSRLQRKMTFAVNAAVRRLCSSNPSRGRSELKRLFDAFDANVVLSQFYKVRDFEKVARVPDKWTFWTYLIRAQKAFGSKGKAIAGQVRSFRRSISHKAGQLIDKYTAIP
jgi:hypothetical protein